MEADMAEVEEDMVAKVDKAQEEIGATQESLGNTHHVRMNSIEISDEIGFSLHHLEKLDKKKLGSLLIDLGRKLQQP